MIVECYGYTVEFTYVEEGAYPHIIARIANGDVNDYDWVAANGTIGERMYSEGNWDIEAVSVFARAFVSLLYRGND